MASTNYGFKVGLCKSQFNDAYLISGKLTTDIGANKIPNGAFVVYDIAGNLTDNIYGSKDVNVVPIKRFSTNDTGSAYIVDLAITPEVTDDNGNTYKIGSILTNLQTGKDTIVRAREMAKNDTFYLFDGNVTGTVSAANKYLVPTNNSFNLTATDTKPNDGFCAVIQDTMALNRGITNVGNQYFCRVIQL